MYTYTAVQLQAKTFGELKSIARELDIVPLGDRRCRQAWIDAIVGVELPLLALIENSPGVETESVQEAIANTDYLNCPRCGTVGGLYAICPGRETVWETLCTYCDYAEPSIRHPFEDVRPFEVDRVQERKEISGFEGDRVQEAIAPVPAVESFLSPLECPFCGALHALYTTKDCLDKPVIKCLHCSYCRIKHYPGPILLEAEEPPIYKPETKDGIDLQDLTFQVQETIAPAAETPPGVTFSDRFLARYFPPQPEIHYQTDADGQLTLFDFEVVAIDKPPDPDDFACLDDFFEAMVAWDAENFEPVEVSLDSMVYWAPCPSDWYEPPDTGIFARLPGPKPPKFPPRAIEQTDDIASVSSSHSGRSPPGGDVMY